LRARSAETPQDLARDAQGRLGALARAHALTLSNPSDSAIGTERQTTVHALIRTIVSPYDADNGGERVAVGGPDFPIAASSVSAFALLLHEFATNAAKYGALSAAEGRIDVACSEEDDRFVLTWQERGGPNIDEEIVEGFGSLLGRATVEGQLGGEIVRVSSPEGLLIRVRVPRHRLID
jgi:two-component sensor histidine kinase